MATTIPMKIEPKTFFANERTFLSWLHMAVTIGSIGAALLGFSGAATHDPKAPAVRKQRQQHPVEYAQLCNVMAAVLMPCDTGRLDHVQECHCHRICIFTGSRNCGTIIHNTTRANVRQVGIANVPDIIAMILLPVAVLMCGYALMVFLWRGSQIARKQARFASSRLVDSRLPAEHCLPSSAVAKTFAPNGCCSEGPRS